jgi:hypothetical protein
MAFGSFCAKTYLCLGQDGVLPGALRVSSMRFLWLDRRTQPPLLQIEMSQPVKGPG